MPGVTFSKFFWSDWRSDPGLRTCSLGARGLWMEMLCIAAEAQPTGYVLVNAKPLSTTDLARMTGAPEAEVISALAELDAAGVFSRDRAQRIYSRRMVRDAKRAKISRKNGKQGGNPSLCNNDDIQSQDNPPVNPGVKPHKPVASISSKNKPLEEDSLTRAGARAMTPRRFVPPEDRKGVWFSEKMIPYINERMLPDAAAAQIQGWLEGDESAIASVNLLDVERKRRERDAA